MISSPPPLALLALKRFPSGALRRFPSLSALAPARLPGLAADGAVDAGLESRWDVEAGVEGFFPPRPLRKQGNPVRMEKGWPAKFYTLTLGEFLRGVTERSGSAF